jgi:hypothetical protein
VSKCKICDHPDRRAIELDIIGGVSIRDVSQKWGINRSAVFRHKKHITEEFAVEQALSPHPVCKSVPAIIETAVSVSQKKHLEGWEVQDAIKMAFDEAVTLIEYSKGTESVKDRATALNTLKGIVELIAKLYGMLNSDGASSSLMQVAGDYEQMREFVMEDLCDDCRLKLLARLEGQTPVLAK